MEHLKQGEGLSNWEGLEYLREGVEVPKRGV